MKLTIHKVLSLFAGLIGIAAFCLMFAAPLQTAGYTGKLISIEPQPIAYNTIFFGNENIQGATGGLIGFILLLVGGLVSLINAFIGKKTTGVNKLLSLTSVLLLLVGAVLVILTKTFFIAQFGEPIQIAPSVTIDPANWYELAIGTIIGAILGAAGALVALVAVLIPCKKTSKKRK